MDIDVCGIDGCAAIDGPAVVIDVLRAFTVAAWAFERGAERILLSNDEADALRVRDDVDGVAINDGVPDGRFDLMNSPDHVAAADLTGRTVVLRTAAGTTGAVAARHAPILFCTGLTTAGATARGLRRLGVERVTLVATGGDDDLACAEHLAALLRGEPTDPAAVAGRVVGSDIARALAQYVRDGNPGVGARDVELACEIDRFPFAMRATDTDGRLVLVRSDET